MIGNWRYSRLMTSRWRGYPFRMISIGAKLPRYDTPSSELVTLLGLAIPSETSKARARGAEAG